MIFKIKFENLKFFHTLWTNENETWKIEKWKNPRNRFSTYAEIIGCNKKSMRPRRKNFTPWNNWNIELLNDTLIVKIERKLFPQLLIPLMKIFFETPCALCQILTSWEQILQKNMQKRTKRSFLVGFSNNNPKKIRLNLDDGK